MSMAPLSEAGAPLSASPIDAHEVADVATDMSLQGSDRPRGFEIASALLFLAWISYRCSYRLLVRLGTCS